MLITNGCGIMGLVVNMRKTNREYKAAYNASEKGRATASRYRRSLTKEKITEYAERHHIRHLASSTAYRKRSNFAKQLVRFGLTEDQYWDLALYGCGLCGNQDPKPGARLAMDHDHSTGAFRGLLCSTCNMRLGWFERRQKKIEEYIRG